MLVVTTITFALKIRSALHNTTHHVIKWAMEGKYTDLNNRIRVFPSLLFFFTFSFSWVMTFFLYMREDLTFGLLNCVCYNGGLYCGIELTCKWIWTHWYDTLRWQTFAPWHLHGCRLNSTPDRASQSYSICSFCLLLGMIRTLCMTGEWIVEILLQCLDHTPMHLWTKTGKKISWRLVSNLRLYIIVDRLKICVALFGYLQLTVAACVDTWALQTELR